MSSSVGNPSCQNYDGSSHVDSHIGKWESYIYFPRMFHYLSQRFESSNVLQIGLKWFTYGFVHVFWISIYIFNN